MKQTIIILGMAFFMQNAFTQSTLSFCASVDQYGNCALNNNKFFLSPDSASARIFIEIKDAQTFAGVSKVTFKFYSVKSGTEVFESTMDQNMQSTWVYAWISHLFTGAGKYTVK